MLGIHVSFCTETLKINEQRAFSVLPFSFSLPGRKTFERASERGRAAGGRGAGAPASGGRREREAGRAASPVAAPRRDLQTLPPRSGPAPTPPPPCARNSAGRPARPARSQTPGAAAGRDAGRNFLNDRVRLAVEHFWVGERKGKWKKTENFLISLAVRHV